MGVPLPGAAQKDLEDGVVVRPNPPPAQELLAVGVGEGGPPLADVAAAHPQGVRGQQHVLRRRGAVLRGKEKILGAEQGDHRGGPVKGVGDGGVVGDAGLFPGDIAAGGGHAGAGVGPLDPSQAEVHLPVLAHHKEGALPPAGAGGVQARLEDLLQRPLVDLPGVKPADGPAVEDGLHHLVHAPATSFQHWGSAA